MPAISANKKLGQHFLQDRGAVRRIVEALAPAAGEPVLEIGPGRGALTEDLLSAAGRLAAVEVDEHLAADLDARLGQRGLLVLRSDVLRVPLREVLQRLGAPPKARLAIAGNLPYNISHPIAEKLVRERDAVGRAVLTFQREVAERLTSGPGSRDYGPLGILAGTAFRIRTLFDLPPGAFRPVPQVVSSVTSWVRREESLDTDLESALRSCLSACFARRRRTLRNNLRAVARDAAAVDRWLEGLGIDGGARAEALPAASFLRMAEHWDRLA
jgi:16S rRNA (adenine1518-N6/adenine1519-N6)-dimethyltransferase